MHELQSFVKNCKFNCEVVIVESGSSDGTTEIIEDFILVDKGRTKFRVYYEPKPKGKGSACKIGIEKSIGKTIVIFDADLEYSLNDLEILVSSMIGRSEKIILGSRHKRHQPMRVFEQSKLRSFYFNQGHRFLTTYFNILFRTRLRDPATMWKVVDGDLARRIKFKSNRFDFDWELLGSFIRLGHNPREVNIHYTSRSPNEGKKIRPVRDPLHWIIRILVFRYRKVQFHENY